VQNGPNGLQLQFLGGGNFTGGYVTTNTQGLLDFVQGSYNLNGTVTSTNTWLNGGNLVGTNVIKGALTWVAGYWNNTVDTIAANSTLLIITGNSHDLAGCTVTNNGTVAWSTGAIRGGGVGGGASRPIGIASDCRVSSGRTAVISVSITPGRTS